MASIFDTADKLFARLFQSRRDVAPNEPVLSTFSRGLTDTYNNAVLEVGADGRVLTSSGRQTLVNADGSVPFAASDDARIVNAPRRVATVAELRELAGQYDDQRILRGGYWTRGDGGEAELFWNAASTDEDDGCKFFRPTATAVNAAGRWQLICPDSFRNVAQCGAVPGQPASVIRERIQAAHDSLSSANGYSKTATGRLLRRGKLYFPPGAYRVDAELYFSLWVRVEGAHVFSSVLQLDDHSFADPNTERWVVRFEKDAAANYNDTFGGGWYKMTLDCRRTAGNPGSSGVFLTGAQLTGADQFFITGFGKRGMIFNGAELGSCWISGDGTQVGPGLTLTGQCVPMLVRYASVEHLNYAGALDADGYKVPAMLIANQDNVNVLAAQGEGGHLFLRIKDSRRVTVGSLTATGMAPNSTMVELRGDTGTVSLPNLRSDAAALVDDTARTGGDGRPVGYRHRLLNSTGIYNYSTDGLFTRLAVENLTVINLNDAGKHKLCLSAAFTKQNDVALSLVPALSFAAGAGQIWTVKAHLLTSNNGQRHPGARVVIGVNGVAGVATIGLLTNDDGKNTNSLGLSGGANTGAGMNFSLPAGYNVRVYTEGIVTTTSAGTVGVWFGQVAADAQPTSLLPDSWLAAERIR